MVPFAVDDVRLGVERRVQRVARDLGVAVRGQRRVVVVRGADGRGARARACRAAATARRSRPAKARRALVPASARTQPASSAAGGDDDGGERLRRRGARGYPTLRVSSRRPVDAAGERRRAALDDRRRRSTTIAPCWRSSYIVRSASSVRPSRTRRAPPRCSSCRRCTRAGSPRDDRASASGAAPAPSRARGTNCPVAEARQVHLREHLAAALRRSCERRLVRRVFVERCLGEDERARVVAEREASFDLAPRLASSDPRRASWGARADPPSISLLESELAGPRAFDVPSRRAAPSGMS